MFQIHMPWSEWTAGIFFEPVFATTHRLTVRWVLGGGGGGGAHSRQSRWDLYGFSADFACLVIVMANWGNHRCIGAFMTMNNRSQLRSWQYGFHLPQYVSWRQANDIFCDWTKHSHESFGRASVLSCLTNAFLHSTESISRFNKTNFICHRHYVRVCVWLRISVFSFSFTVAVAH